MNSTSFSLTFGPYALDFPQRTLSRDGQILRIGSRALDLLVALAQAPGELLSRDALLQQVWPGNVVDEGALRVHLSALRKALGEARDGVSYIGNEPGRGYRFLVPVQRRFSVGMLGEPPRCVAPTPVPGHNLPGQITRVLGRGDIIERLLGQLEARRCLTISGPGGLGKTTVALAIAHRFVEQHIGRACFVDFAPLSDPGRVLGALAVALGVVQTGPDPLQEILAALGQQTILLLLDNCEHMVEPLAPIAERLLREAAGVHLLATSREPLRAAGEWIHRLATLETPDADASLSTEQALAYPAVRLFVERATAVRQDFTLNEANLEAVCKICRSLDGIPLAIEFAAARADWLTVQDIANHLDARFNLLTKGRRTALPRQQTLRATLDWSYELLAPAAQALLRRIALFRTSFDLSAMLAVAMQAVTTEHAGASLDDNAVSDAAAELVAKSLLNCDMRGATPQFRLLDTTRYYGVDRLAESHVEDQLARLRHALYCTALFTESQEAWDGNAQRERRALHSLRIDDIRSALDWAFSGHGDAAVGIALIVASAHLWFELSLPKEFIVLAELALTRIAATPHHNTRMHLDLLAVYGGAHWPTYGPVQSMSDAYEAAIEIARRLGDEALIMRAVWGLWIERLLNGRYADSNVFAEEYFALAQASAVTGNISTGHNMLALSHHFYGNAQLACEQIALTLASDAAPERRSHANAAQLDGYLSAQGNVMLFSHLRGDFAKALRVARAGAEASLALDHDLTLCAVLATGAIPVAIWAGERILAEEWIAALRERAQRRGMVYWDRWGEGYAAALDDLPMNLEAATVMQIETFAGLGLTCAIEHLEQRGWRFAQTWLQPELMRRHAEQSSEPHGAEAIEALQIALRIAQMQCAGLWQLRITLSLAQARHAGNDPVARQAAVLALDVLFQQHADAPDHPDVAAAERFLHHARGS